MLTRLVPLHPRTTAALRSYATERDRLWPARTSRAFFVSGAGTRLGRSDVAKTLRRITTAMGLRTDTVHPTAHQLRHSFAVRTLIDWHRSGVRVDEHIATLSTYLGHVSPADTYWYLSASPELMGLAAGGNAQGFVVDLVERLLPPEPLLSAHGVAALPAISCRRPLRREPHRSVAGERGKASGEEGLEYHLDLCAGGLGRELSPRWQVPSAPVHGAPLL